jgi:Fic family protein
MNPDIPATAHGGLERQQSHGYVSSGSESRKASSSSSKKRASRAGTRSVSTLSAAQLERKRANDREAQRAIRQRTKDHIDHLEKTVSELRGSQESADKLVSVTQQRNRELEEENAYLRSKLNEAGYSMGIPGEGEKTHSRWWQFCSNS